MNQANENIVPRSVYTRYKVSEIEKYGNENK